MSKRLSYADAAQYLELAEDLTIDPVAHLPGAAKTGGYVYFMLCHGPEQFIKIGRATDIAKRLSNAQVGSPYEIRVVAFVWAKDPAALERSVHRKLASSRTQGEWFRLSPEVRGYVVSTRRDMFRAANSRLAAMDGANP